MPSKPEIIITEDPAQLATRAAGILMTKAQEGVHQTGFFSVAISGGSTPRGMHKLLAEEPYRSGIPWAKIHIYWVDERCVAVDDPASNFGSARKDFLDRIPIPPEQIHPMPGGFAPEEGARKYQEEMEVISQISGEDFPVFDLVFLGLGKDGHTASLFPGRPSAVESERWVVVVKGGNPDVYRLTLTYEVLNRAKRICFLVSGKDKALILKTVFENQDARLPAHKIQPEKGKVTWVLDKDAASLLSKEMIRDAS